MKRVSLDLNYYIHKDFYFMIYNAIPDPICNENDALFFEQVNYYDDRTISIGLEARSNKSTTTVLLYILFGVRYITYAASFPLHPLLSYIHTLCLRELVNVVCNHGRENIFL